jgi:hypothetical protein
MSDTPRTLKLLDKLLDEDGVLEEENAPFVWVRLSKGIERELNAALAANAELLERLRERTESHLAASARDVQTIQQQAVEIDRLKNILNHGQH